MTGKRNYYKWKSSMQATIDTMFVNEKKDYLNIFVLSILKTPCIYSTSYYPAKIFGWGRGFYCLLPILCFPSPLPFDPAQQTASVYYDEQRERIKFPAHLLAQLQTYPPRPPPYP